MGGKFNQIIIMETDGVVFYRFILLLKGFFVQITRNCFKLSIFLYVNGGVLNKKNRTRGYID